MTSIFLVRHASHDLLGKILCGRMVGVVLSEKGRNEAVGVARRLAREEIVAMFASPLERARETAAPIAKALGLPILAANALQEIDFGAWTGVQLSELREDPLWRERTVNRGSAKPPGGETLAQAQARIVGWMDEVARTYPGQAVAAVSHGDVIKAAVAAALDLDLGNVDRFEIGPASVSTLRAGPGGLRVVALNEIAGWDGSAL